MFLSGGKSLSCAFFLGVLFCFSPNVSAQSKIPEQTATYFAEKSIEKPDESEINSEKIHVGDSQNLTNRRKSLQTDDFDEKIDTEYTGIDKNKRFGNFHQSAINNFTSDFRSNDVRGNRALKLKSFLIENKEPSFRPPRRQTFDFPDNPNDVISSKDGFQWRSAIQQSMIFLAVQHGYALTQPKTREALKGNFFKDYAASVKSLSGWDDGGRFFTNFVAHPMQGAMTGFIYVQNDPQAARQQFGRSGDYWRSRMRAMAWTAIWSTQFEIGPVSQASIGNVGLSGKQTWEDIVVTPTLGTAWLIAEDAADRFITQRIEDKTDNFYIKIFSRMLLSPTRIFANMLRFKVPWYRDRDRILE